MIRLFNFHSTTDFSNDSGTSGSATAVTLHIYIQATQALHPVTIYKNNLLKLEQVSWNFIVLALGQLYYGSCNIDEWMSGNFIFTWSWQCFPCVVDSLMFPTSSHEMNVWQWWCFWTRVSGAATPFAPLTRRTNTEFASMCMGTKSDKACNERSRTDSKFAVSALLALLVAPVFCHCLSLRHAFHISGACLSGIFDFQLFHIFT